MPPLTRRQSNMQTADAQLQRPSDEPSRNETATPLFLSMPAELQKTVVEYVTQNSDMRNVCRVSKEFHALMLPYLYRHVAFHVFHLKENLHEMFHPSNPGLPYIRTLRIQDSCTPMFNNVKHLSVLCHLLTVIPKNILRIFELSTTAPVHQDISLLVRARQQQLTNHQHLSLHPTSQTLTPPSDEISHVSSLQLYLGNEWDCDIARQLLESMSSVTSLSIRLRDHRLDQTMGGKGEVGKKVITKIFGSAKWSNSHRKLKRLRIEQMSFKTAGSILPAVLPLDGLEHLFLFRCSYTDRLCEKISHLKLRLKSYCDLRAYKMKHPGAYDTFLKSLQPLHKLRLSYTGTNTDERNACEWSSILPHASELRCLDLRDSDQSTLLGCHERFFDRIPLFLHERLSPTAALDQWPESPKGKLGHATWIGCLLGCLSHEDLYRSVYEDDNDDSDDDANVELGRLRLDKWCTLAASEAKVAADHIFASLADSCPRFVVLAIDINEHLGAELEITGFLRSTQTDAFGRTDCVALPIDWRTLKYHAPCPEILHDIVEEDLSKC